MNPIRLSLTTQFLSLNLLDFFPLLFAENLMNSNSFGFWQINQPYLNQGGRLCPPNHYLQPPLQIFQTFHHPCVLYLCTDRCICNSSWSTTQMALQSIYPCRYLLVDPVIPQSSHSLVKWCLNFFKQTNF